MSYVADRARVVIAWSRYGWRVIIKSQATIESDADVSAPSCISSPYVFGIPLLNHILDKIHVTYFFDFIFSFFVGFELHFSNICTHLTSIAASRIKVDDIIHKVTNRIFLSTENILALLLHSNFILKNLPLLTGFWYDLMIFRYFWVTLYMRQSLLLFAQLCTMYWSHQSSSRLEATAVLSIVARNYSG